MLGVRQRVRERELRAVRDAVQRDLVDAEGGPHRVQVLRVLGGAVEVARGADRRCAAGRRELLLVGADRALEDRAVDQPGLAGAAVVVGDEAVAGEEVAVELHRRRRPETEDVRRALAGPAGDEEQRPPLGAVGREVLDVERDRPRDAAGPVERDGNDRALEAGGLAAGGGGERVCAASAPPNPCAPARAAPVAEAATSVRGYQRNRESPGHGEQRVATGV